MAGLQTSRANWNKTTAAHLLNRAGFGALPEEIQQAADRGMAKTVDYLVDFENIPTAFPPPSLPDNPESPSALRKLNTEELQALLRANVAAIEDIRGWWIQRMLTSPRPLEEKLTLFWHGHFTSNADDVMNARHMFRQNEFLRQNCHGNFHTLVLGISRDPAMLRYLDNNTNQKSHPNENYARELLELFTMGIGNYTEDDVLAAARAFTGWTFRGDEFQFASFHHDYGPKKFLGETGNFDGTDILAIVLKQPVTARFMAKKLFEFFVHENPAPALVEELAQVFRAGNYELKPFLRTLFRSEVFYSVPAWRTQIKSPVQLVVGTARLLGVQADPRQLARAMRLLGQDLLFPPTVKGWDGGETWINTNSLLMRYNLSRYFLTGQLPGEGRAAAASHDLAAIIPKEIAVEPAKVVNTLVARLLQAPLETKARQWLTDQAITVRYKERAAVVAHLIMSMPDYQLC